MDVIGRIEKVNFSKFRISNIDAKIDTGAFSSSIHCSSIKENKINNELIFKVLDPEHKEFKNLEFIATKYSKTLVKSAVGQSETRFKIKTTIELGERSFEATFTLTDRSHMKYPVLLGRNALNKRFIVDVSQKHLLSK